MFSEQPRYWVNESIEDVSLMLAKRAMAGRELRAWTKQADLAALLEQAKAYGGQALNAVKSNPNIAAPAIGAAIGGGLGGLSSLARPKEERQSLRSILSGALAGGAAGWGGHQALKSFGPGGTAYGKHAPQTSPAPTNAGPKPAGPPAVTSPEDMAQSLAAQEAMEAAKPTEDGWLSSGAKAVGRDALHLGKDTVVGTWNMAPEPVKWMAGADVARRGLGAYGASRGMVDTRPGAITASIKKMMASDATGKGTKELLDVLGRTHQEDIYKLFNQLNENPSMLKSVVNGQTLERGLAEQISRHGAGSIRPGFGRTLQYLAKRDGAPGLRMLEGDTAKALSRVGGGWRGKLLSALLYGGAAGLPYLASKLTGSNSSASHTGQPNRYLSPPQSQGQ